MLITVKQYQKNNLYSALCSQISETFFIFLVSWYMFEKRFQKLVPRVLSGFPNTRKLMKARGRSFSRKPVKVGLVLSSVISCLETPMKHEARVFEILRQKLRCIVPLYPKGRWIVVDIYIHRSSPTLRGIVVLVFTKSDKNNASLISSSETFAKRRAISLSVRKTVNIHGYSELREPIKTRENCYPLIW